MRPKITEDATRVRLTAQQKNKLARLEQQSGLNTSALIRLLIDNVEHITPLVMPTVKFVSGQDQLTA
jgi:hypothetical protein